MVQLKYFGDSRDFFKYDLITGVLKRSSLRHYVFVPMLTEHRHDHEGKKPSRNNGDKSSDLLEFIISRDGKSLKHWRDWFGRYVESYNTLEPVDEIFFSDQGRDAYWCMYRPMLGRQNALIFVDPDTGLETGNPSYLRRMGREKYILNSELKFLIDELDRSSVLMVYQHLPNNKNTHNVATEKKLEQVRGVYPSVYTCAFREDDLAFLFVMKERSIYDEIYGVLESSHSTSNCKYKSLHGKQADGVVGQL